MDRLRERPALAAAIDALAVVVFVVLGRRSHDEGLSLSSIAEVAAPFLIALVVAWAVTRAWKHPLDLPTGVNVALLTSALGLALRRFVFDRSTAMAFVIVGTVMIGILFVGWRALVAAATRAKV